MSKYGFFSCPYFPAFELITERYFVSLRIQSECGKIQTRKNSVFGHFSHSVDVHAQHKSDDEEESQSEVSEVLIKPSLPQLRAAIDTLMNYSMIVGAVSCKG